MPKEKTTGCWSSNKTPVGEVVDVGQREKELAEIYAMCRMPIQKTIQTLRNNEQCLKQLALLVSMITPEDVKKLKLKHLLWSSLTLFCFFKLHFMRSQRAVIGRWIRRRYHERARQLYWDLMEKIAEADIKEDIFVYILNFLSEFRLWRHEHFAIDALHTPVACGESGAVLLSHMLDLLEQLGDENEQDGRHLLRVLYDVLKTYDWPSLDTTSARAITRLLKMYRTAVRLEYQQELVSPVAAGSYSRKGLEVSIRRVIDHMQNSDLMLIVGYMVEWVSDPKLSDQTILDFGTVLEHAAIVHRTESYKLTFSHKLFDILFEIVGSERRVISHLGNRILHHLLDRHENRMKFESPKIFFQNTPFPINLCECLKDDKNFLKKHRAQIHETMMRAVVKHAMYRVNLESIYTTICLLVTEVPCGYSAAALVNLVMNIQDAARNNTDFLAKVRYYLHALVLSVLSLICWLHNAHDFYKYLNKIINRRAEEAPHLNPPLRRSYKFAQHHVLWDKSELFFDDWEVRYSLWMKFKIRDNEIFITPRFQLESTMFKALKDEDNKLKRDN